MLDIEKIKQIVRLQMSRIKTAETVINILQPINSQVLVCYKSTKCTICLHFLALKHFDLLPLVIRITTVPVFYIKDYFLKKYLKANIFIWLFVEGTTGGLL